MSNIVCPNCGESYYAEKYSTRTAMYYPAIWKEGINQNPDGNITTTYCECINCHYSFYYEEQYGKIINTVLGTKVVPVPVINIPINGPTNIVKTDDSFTISTTGNITITSEQSRDAEIKRLEQQIESLKLQLQEIKANPEWHQ